MMHELTSVLPAWLTLLLLTVIPATIVTLIHAVFRRRVSAQRLREQQEVAGFLVAVVAVVYAVVLGFIVVTASISFDSAQRTADAEAGDVEDLAGLARMLDEPPRSQIHRLLGEYAFEVRDVEWPM
ncbi:MAG: hypothetical protein JO165_05300, partial [Candidatus Eremiobacteraeota bacterium]|nr:hypothetical protein [Candidatus Eremiobacteraeota bacterium]